jgi:hypothetical protein
MRGAPYITRHHQAMMETAADKTGTTQRLFIVVTMQQINLSQDAEKPIS